VRRPNPITALDGALSCAYLDTEIDRRSLARCAMLGAGRTGAPIVLRVYVSSDQADAFVHDFTVFSGGRVRGGAILGHGAAAFCGCVAE
jgi:hypothetical protein